MAARKQSPETVLLNGARVTVVHTAPTYWTEQRDDGSLVHHAGKVAKGQIPGKWLPEPKPCSICKVPTQYATPRGRAIHPACEGWTTVLTDEVFAQTVFALGADLAVTAMSIATTPDKELRRAAA